MSWSKRQFIVQAFEEMGYASYEFDMDPERLQSALRRMDSMVAGWNAVGIHIGYPIPGSPQNSNIDDETGVPDSANEAIYLGLALRLAPSVGKVLSPDTKALAVAAYQRLANQAAMPTPERSMPGNMPVGAGHKSWGSTQQPFFSPQSESLSPSDGDAAFDFE